MHIFSVGDIVFARRPSVNSMLYYGEHKREFVCPCKRSNVTGTIIEIRGNFAVVVYTDTGEKTVYYLTDLKPIGDTK